MIKPHFKTAVQAPYYTVYIHSATGMKIHPSCIVMVLVVRKTFLIVGCGSSSTVVSRGVWLVLESYYTTLSVQYPCTYTLI